LRTVAGTPRIGPPVAQVGKMICVGLNYADHAAEAGMPVPELPVIFMKATTAVVGPNDDIVIPRGWQKTDWEVELGAVIGEAAREMTRAYAPNHIGGLSGGQPLQGECRRFDPSAPTN
jgi:2,4-diketo-3-deoxy-L-fuconate hydrolase